MGEETAAWPLSLRLLHWASAALVLAALALGIYTVQLVHDPAARFELTQTHKSIGVTVLAFLPTAPKLAATLSSSRSEGAN